MATQTDTPPQWADSKESWGERVHDAILDSGMKVTFRDLSLVEHALLGELPEELLEIAVREWADPGSSLELAKQPYEDLPAKPTAKQRAAADKASNEILERIKALNRHLIAAALVAPEMTIEELERVPMPDLERLSALINRATPYDAAGRHVGVVPIDRFRAVLDAHGISECPPGCASCEAARRRLSTLRRG